MNYISSKVRKIGLGCFLFFFLLPMHSFCQHSIKGEVVNSETNQPVPFVNIAIPNTYYGTITNSDGKFSISIPVNYLEKEMVFSCIGYKSDTFLLSNEINELNVGLKKQINEISEVLVMSENTLYQLLKKSYDKIPQNYPLSNTNYEGFYRETMKDDSNNYLYFGEAYIETVRGSVNLKNDRGQIKIVKSRGGNLSGKDSTTSFRFYGGIFLSTNDFVQNHSSFINPAHFNKYNYYVQKNDDFYKVSFSSKKRENGFTGYFLIDTLTLAYTEAKIKYNRNGIHPFYDKQFGERFTRFIYMDGNYYLKYCYFKGSGVDKLKNKKLHHFAEFLATKIIPESAKLIPDEEQIRYSDVFIDQLPNYSDLYWDGFNILEADSLLKSNQQTKSALNSSVKNNSNNTLKLKMAQVAPRLTFNYGFVISSGNISNGIYKLGLHTLNQAFEKTVQNEMYFGITSSMGYFFANKLAAEIKTVTELGTSNIFKETLLGLRFKNKINRFGRLYYFSVGTYLGESTSKIKFGSFQNQEAISWRNKRITAKKVDVLLGNKSYVLKPELSLYRSNKGIRSFYISLSYNFAIFEEEVIMLKEKSGIIRKKASVRLGDASYSMFKDDISIQSPGISVPKFTVSFGINLLK